MPPTTSPFRSAAVADAAQRAAALVADPALRATFLNCVTNTLDTTVAFRDGDPPDTHVITGDIPAMWLRDSTGQVWPYLRIAAEDPVLARLLWGVAARQWRNVALDAYANSFLQDPSEHSEWTTDRTEMRPGVHERKYEVDSLAYVIRLAHGCWRATGDSAPLGADWFAAMRRIVEVWRVEQDHSARSPYRFERIGGAPTDTLANSGHGTPVGRTGMTWSGFRPSDDACTMHYLIPSQAMAVVELRHLAEMASALGHCDLAADAAALGAEIALGIRLHGLNEHPDHGRIYAYEADGLGGTVLMDDANVPSLLSLPYLGYCGADDPLYAATRRFVLGPGNPFFAAGRFGAGVGSPHTPPGRVWPMAVVMQAMTSTDGAEIVACLRTLRALAADRLRMNESVDPSDPSKYSRAWFAWACSLFGELILDLADRAPELLQTPLD